MKKTILIAIVTVLAMSAQAATNTPAPAAPADSIRKASTVVAFRKANPCPVTGKVQTSCPGYVVDHVIPLCAGGLDEVANMRYEVTAESYRKDIWERSICKRLTTCTKAAK